MGQREMETAAMSREPSETRSVAPQKRKFAEIYDTPTIALIGSQKTFWVHKGVLETVPFFKTLFKPTWAPDQKEVDFRDESATALRNFTHWLYRGEVEENLCNIECDNQNDEAMDISPDDDGRWSFEQLISCYQFADKMMCTPYKNAMVEFWVRRFRVSGGAPSLYALAGIFDMGCSDDGLLDFSLEKIAYELLQPMDGDGAKVIWDWQCEALKTRPLLSIRLLETIAEYAQKPFNDPAHVPNCTYHNQDDDSSCS